MDFHIDNIERDGVKLEVKDNILNISGNIISQNPGEFLDPFFSLFHKKTVEMKCKEITVDIRELSFLNSAGIRSLVDWILALEKLPDEKKYKITILCNPKFHWQNISINSLIYLSPSLVCKKEF